MKRFTDLKNFEDFANVVSNHMDGDFDSAFAQELEDLMADFEDLKARFALFNSWMDKAQEENEDIWTDTIEVYNNSGAGDAEEDYQTIKDATR